MNNSCNEKRAFTLAETLITITIIGVVMALMLRAINRVNPDKDKILFVKTYHALEAVIADVINDPKKYDQSFYTDEELADMDASSIHIDFRYAPYNTAKVTYIDSSGKEQTKGVDAATGTGTALTKDNAICYFIADQLNTIGPINCENNNGITINGKMEKYINMRLSNGACLSSLHGVTNDGFLNFGIVPTCSVGDISEDNKRSETLYTVHLYKDGKMTVPDYTACEAMNPGWCPKNQDKAFGWMQNQAELNDKK